jgi:tRNA G18 (ribose-2'-O)-methylase SpoU
VITLAIEVEHAVFFKILKLKRKNMLLVFGNEVHGVSQEAVALCTGCIESTWN